MRNMWQGGVLGPEINFKASVFASTRQPGLKVVVFRGSETLNDWLQDAAVVTPIQSL